MPHNEGPSQEAGWKYGPVLVTYGAFSIRECWKVFDGIRRFHFHELVFRATPSSPNQDAETISIALIGLRRTDLVYVVRWARIWVNGRRHDLAMNHRATSHMPDDTAPLSLHVAENDKNTSDELDGSDTGWGKELSSDPNGAQPEEASDEDVDEAAWEARMVHETELVAQALQELEAQHPELDLEPFEETNNPDPEFDEELRRSTQAEDNWDNKMQS